MKKPTTKNLRSEAAIKRLLKSYSKSHIELSWLACEPVVVFFKVTPSKGGWGTDFDAIAEIDLREVVKKRAPLIGAKKQFASIIRGRKQKKRKGE